MKPWKWMNEGKLVMTKKVLSYNVKEIVNKILESSKNDRIWRGNKISPQSLG
jgi:hypothetical protein